MEDLIKNLKAYFDSATKEQLEKDWEELEPYSHIGPEIFSFLDEQYKQMKDFKLTINERNLSDLVSPIEQVNKLKEIGFKTKNNIFCFKKTDKENYEIIIKNNKEKDTIDTLSCSEILLLLPSSIKETNDNDKKELAKLVMFKRGYEYGFFEWGYSFENGDIIYSTMSFRDGLFDLLYQIIKNKKLKKIENVH